MRRARRGSGENVANPWHHAVSSAKRWGGEPEDYLAVHSWFDASKAHLADFRHRALRHHTEGIFECEREFGPTIDVTIGWSVGGEMFKDKAEAAFRARDLHGLPPTAAFEEHVTRVTKKVPTRWVGELHVMEDCGRIPTLADWFLHIVPQSWMNRSRPLSREQEGGA